MGDDKDDVRYPPNSLGSDSSHGQKLDVRNAAYAQPVGNRYVNDEEDGEEEDYEEEDPGNGVQRIVKYVGTDGDDDESDGEGPDNGVQRMDSDDDDDSDSDGEDGVDLHEKHNGYDLSVEVEDVDAARHPKKRKMKSLISSYEFAPRVPAPVPPRPAPAPAPPAPKPSTGGRNSLTDWTEHETLVLLDAWGERFLRRGRKSLRFEEWQEVTEKVSGVSRIERTDTQCRNRLDTLKKKYKKEKTAEFSKWVYFKKMDMLMSSSPSPSSPPQRPGLSCGLDSGGYVFVNPTVYPSRANGLNEMRDSPDDDSESTEGDNDSDGLPPKKRRSGRDKDNDVDDEGSSFRLLADCIHKFSSIYEKTENNKRKQIAELEKMRMDFHRDLEMQKRQIIERAKADIARIQKENENA